MLPQSVLQQHYFFWPKKYILRLPPLLWQFPSHVRLHNKPGAEIICF